MIAEEKIGRSAKIAVERRGKNSFEEDSIIPSLSFQAILINFLKFLFNFCLCQNSLFFGIATKVLGSGGIDFHQGSLYNKFTILLFRNYPHCKTTKESIVESVLSFARLVAKASDKEYPILFTGLSAYPITGFLCREAPLQTTSSGRRPE